MATARRKRIQRDEFVARVERAAPTLPTEQVEAWLSQVRATYARSEVATLAGTSAAEGAKEAYGRALDVAAVLQRELDKRRAGAARAEAS